MTVEDRAGGGQAELDPSQIHNVLRNDRRRCAIEHLRDADGEVSVDELAEHVASVETGESPPPRDVRKSVYVSLHQTHLPKLDELDIIEYDQRAQGIELRDRAEQVEVYMEVVPEDDISWGTYYLGVSVLGAITLFAVEFELVPSFDVRFWAWYFLALVGVSAVYHAYAERTRRVFGD